MKKILSTALCLVLAACLLAGCTGGGASSRPTASNVSESPATVAAPYKIGLVQYMEHTALDTTREAFMSRLEEWGYDETKVEIDYQNAGGDSAKAGTICEKFVKDEVDMIVAISTPAAKAAVSSAKGTDVTVLFAGVNDPQTDLGVQNPEAPEGNVTGTSDRVPVTAILDLALQADPGLQTLGLLYHAGESNSLAAAEAAKTACEEKGIAVVEKAVSGPGEVQQAAADLSTQVDAIFTATDNSVASSAAAVAEAARKAKVPWYVGADSMVQEGALAAISIDYTELGNKNADMAVRLMEGKPVSQVPVFFFESYQTYINQTTLDQMEVEFPKEVLETAAFFQ